MESRLITTFDQDLANPGSLPFSYSRARVYLYLEFVAFVARAIQERMR